MGTAEPSADSRGLARQAGERARNLFLTRQMHCAEAVLVTLNRGFGGGLTDDQAFALATPFSEGIADSGCLCGALGGALMAIGLFLCRDNPTGRRREAHSASARFLKRFKMRHGSACCRVLARKDRGDAKAHFNRCAEFTAEAARSAAEIILAQCPGLAARAQKDFLEERDTLLGGVVRSVVRRVGGRLG